MSNWECSVSASNNGASPAAETQSILKIRHDPIEIKPEAEKTNCVSNESQENIDAMKNEIASDALPSLPKIHKKYLKLPASIRATKPEAIPNDKYLDRESQVRRKTLTASTTVSRRLDRILKVTIRELWYWELRGFTQSLPFRQR